MFTGIVCPHGPAHWKPEGTKMALIENLTEDFDPTMQVGDVVRTAMTAGDTDSLTWTGATAGTVYTVSITGLDPAASYVLEISNIYHGATFNTQGDPIVSSMSLLAATIINGEIHFALPAGWTMDYTISLTQTGGTGSTLVDIAVTPGNTLTIGDGHDLLQGSAETLPVIDGGLGNDTLSGNSTTELLLGGAGNDRLSMSTAGATTIDGGEGNDTLYTAGGGDLVLGGEGDDQILSRFGNSTVNGGAGNDWMMGLSNNDTYAFEDGSGQDTIDRFTSGNSVVDVSALGITSFNELDITDTVDGALITFSPGNSVLFTGLEAAYLTEAHFIFGTLPPPPSDEVVLNEITGSGQFGGTDLADLITGSIGDDKINAHDGDDEIHGGAGKDVLTGHGGDDLIYGGTGNDNLYGREGNDTLDGGANNDKLMGGDGDDLLLGGDGNDKLWGDAGNDTLNGGTGKDDLTGGTGADVFVFDSSSKIGRIMDFEDGIDQIDLTGLADAGITRFDMLSLVQSGSMAIVSLSGSNRIELMNTDITDLDASDFIF